MKWKSSQKNTGASDNSGLILAGVPVLGARSKDCSTSGVYCGPHLLKLPRSTSNSSRVYPDPPM